MAKKSTVGELVYKISGDGKGLGVTLAKSEKQVKGFGKSFGNFNKKSVAALAGIGVGVAVLGSTLVSATKKAIAFETHIANLSTLMGDNTKAVGEMKKGILEMTKIIPRSSDELGLAAYDILSAGITETSDALLVLEASGKLAVAGLGTTKEAVNLVTSAINAFEIDAEDAIAVSNTLFATVRAGKTTVGEMAQSFGNVAAAAKGAGVSFEETQAATAALTVVGFRTATAQDRLRALFDEMTRSSGKLNDSYDTLGKGSIATAVQSDGFKNVLDDLLVSVNGDTVAFKNMFSSVEAGGAALALVTGASDTYNDTLTDMLSSSGDLEKAFGKQAETTANKLALAQNQMNDLLIRLGEQILPLINKVLDVTVDAFEKLDNMVATNAETQEIYDKTLEDSMVIQNKAIARLNIFRNRVKAAKLTGDEQTQQLAESAQESARLHIELIGLGQSEEDLARFAEIRTRRQEILTNEVKEYIKQVENQGKAVLDAGGKEEYLAKQIQEQEEAMKESQKAAEEARKTLEGFQGQLVNIVESSRELSKELKEDLSESLRKFGEDITGNVGESQKGLASIVISAEEKKKSILEQLAKEEDADRRASLQKELDEQEATLNARIGFEERQAQTIKDIKEKLAEAGIEVELDGLSDVMTLDEQVAEQRRVMDLDEFSRFEEQQTAKLLRLAEDLIKEHDIIVNKIETQKAYEQELTDFLIETNQVRTDSVDEWANSTIATYGRVASELQSLLSLQSRLGSVTAPQFDAGSVVGATSGGSVDNSKTVNATNTFNVTTNDQADLSALSRELGFELRGL